MRTAMRGATLVAALVAGLLGAAQAAADDATILREAWNLAESRDYAAADAAARRARDPVVAELTAWRRLIRGDGTFAEMRAHLQRRPAWAGADLVRREAERAMPRLDPQEALAFIGDAPLTGAGALRRAEALAALGRRGEAEAAIRDAWRTLPLTQTEREGIEAQWPAVARAEAEARLDEMLWRGEEAQARAVLPLASPGWRALAEARITLRNRANGVDARIAAVPASLSNHPGLAYERFVWRDRADRDADAEALLVQRTGSAEALGRPEFWAERRARIARRVFREGRAFEAYRIASAHHLKEGSDFSDLEWLSGWFALRGLNDPERAAGHFLRLWHDVETPISLGRAGYWLGRAYEAAGDAVRAETWYRRGAEHATSFYGQLAAERVGLDPTAALAARDGVDWRAVRFVDDDTQRALRLMAAAGHGNRARWFLRSLAEGFTTREQFAAAGAFAIEIGRTDAAVRLAKDAARAGFVIMDIYYPVTDLARHSGPIEPALAKAIARQESELNPEAVSPAGARGVMQLMPATAEKVARDLGLAYDRGRLTADPLYNARLGTAYLAEMRARFGGALMLAVAAYNAGPNRVDAWLGRYGDPRLRVDPIDWAESIPFSETRNYVQRVLEGLHVYRARLGAPSPEGYLGALTRPNG